MPYSTQDTELSLLLLHEHHTLSFYFPVGEWRLWLFVLHTILTVKEPFGTVPNSSLWFPTVCVQYRRWRGVETGYLTLMIIIIM